MPILKLYMLAGEVGNIELILAIAGVVVAIPLFIFLIYKYGKNKGRVEIDSRPGDEEQQ